jgi:hypothetical protein
MQKGRKCFLIKETGNAERKEVILDKETRLCREEGSDT